jgi:hypothetical protein
VQVIPVAEPNLTSGRVPCPTIFEITSTHASPSVRTFSFETDDHWIGHKVGEFSSTVVIQGTDVNDRRRPLPALSQHTAAKGTMTRGRRPELVPVTAFPDTTGQLVHRRHRPASPTKSLERRGTSAALMPETVTRYLASKSVVVLTPAMGHEAG